MTKTNGVKMTAWLLTLTVAAGISFGLPRAARAGDAGKIIGAVAAGVILYELLDDDDDHGRVCRPDRGWGPGRAGWYRDGVPPYPYGKGEVVRGWGYRDAPYTAPWGHGPGGRWDSGRRGTRLEVYRGPYGTSIDFGYRDCGRR